MILQTIWRSWFDSRHLHHATILSNILQDLDDVDIDLAFRIPKMATVENKRVD